MKRIEKALKEWNITKEEILNEYCPFNLNICEDNYTGEFGYSEKEDFVIYGCNGITCVECWNKEI